MPIKNINGGRNINTHIQKISKQLYSDLLEKSEENINNIDTNNEKSLPNKELVEKLLIKHEKFIKDCKLKKKYYIIAHKIFLDLVEKYDKIYNNMADNETLKLSLQLKKFINTTKNLKTIDKNQLKKLMTHSLKVKEDINNIDDDINKKHKKLVETILTMKNKKKKVKSQKKLLKGILKKSKKNFYNNNDNNNNNNREAKNKYQLELLKLKKARKNADKAKLNAKKLSAIANNKLLLSKNESKHINELKEKFEKEMAIKMDKAEKAEEKAKIAIKEAEEKALKAKEEENRASKYKNQELLEKAKEYAKMASLEAIQADQQAKIKEEDASKAQKEVAELKDTIKVQESETLEKIKIAQDNALKAAQDAKEAIKIQKELSEKSKLTEEDFEKIRKEVQAAKNNELESKLKEKELQLEQKLLEISERENKIEERQNKLEKDTSEYQKYLQEMQKSESEQTDAESVQPQQVQPQQCHKPSCKKYRVSIRSNVNIIRIY